METCPFCFVWRKYLKKFYAYIGILGVGINGSGKYQGEIQMVSKKIVVGANIGEIEDFIKNNFQE